MWSLFKMLPVRAGFIVVLVLVIAPGLFASSAQAKVVGPDTFGQHVHDFSSFSSARFGSVRLWDNGVRWDEVNTAPGVYDWPRLDAVVASASGSSSNLLYVLGGTPSWAKEVRCSTPNYLGAKYSNCVPRLGPWKSWVRAVVKRYKGRIGTYQVWNEVNFSSFFDGKPAQMVRLTDVAARIIKAQDRNAKVVTGSVIVRLGRSVSKQHVVKSSRSFAWKYFKGLSDSRTPVWGVGVHLYPWYKYGPGDGTPTDRLKAIKQTESVLRSTRLPSRLVDTEMGYGNRRNNGWPMRVLDDRTASVYVGQTYIQSLFTPVARTYFYGWDDHVLGIDFTTPFSPELLGPARMYNWVYGSLSGVNVSKCKTGNVIRCDFVSSSGKKGLVAYATKGTATVKIPAGSTVSTYDGQMVVSASSVTVGDVPVIVLYP